MNNDWDHRVTQYLNDLEQIAGSIDSILAETQLETSAVNAEEVETSTALLQESLASLEQKVAERDALLRAPDVPAKGLTLTEVLRTTQRPKHEQLAKRCDALAELIADANHRAISIFVCQFNLANLSGEIVRLISGGDLPSTYGSADRSGESTRGGLFNESA